MFCDQDDVWLPNKIEKSVEAIKKLESDNPAVSALVYCDMKVVDENLKEIASSFIKYNALSVDEITIDRAVMKGYAAGCTMIINNTLAKPFVVSNRGGTSLNMNSRFQTLYCKLGIRSRSFSQLDTSAPFEINFEGIFEKLRDERAIFREYLERCLVEEKGYDN